MEACLTYLVEKTHLTLKALFVAVGCVVATVLLPTVLLANENKEEDQFRCYDVPKGAKLRDDCYDAYNRLYNQFNLPLYGYVYINFGLAICVYILYCFSAHGRIAELERDTTRINLAERHIRRTQRTLFWAYIIQVILRIIVFLVCPIIQCFWIFSVAFPENFPCPCSKDNGCGNNVTSVGLNGTSTPKNYTCRNPQATTKTHCGYALVGLNVAFFLVSLCEFIRLICKAVNESRFTEDGTFWASYLKGNSEARRQVKNFVTTLRKQILNDTRYMVGLIPGGIKKTKIINPTSDEPEENDKDLNKEIFVDLTIQTGRKHSGAVCFYNKEDATLQAYVKAKGSKFVEKQLFPPNTETQDPRTILAVGCPGIGKTSLVTKILRDWAKGALATANQAAKCFDFVFLLQFQQLNFDKNITLQELLSLSPYSVNLTDKVFEQIVTIPEKVLLVFDGLDEAKSLNDIERHGEYASSEIAKMPVSALFAKLASGKLLDGATIVTTTRSTAIPGVVERFYRKIADKFLELDILGFTHDQAKEYVKDTTAPEDQNETIWNHISSRANLLSLCYFPVNCVMVCTYLMDILQNINGARDQSFPHQLPTTLTEVYKGALKGYILKSHSSYREKEPERREFNPDSAFRREVEKMLHKLGILAEKGLQNGKLKFSKTEILKLAKHDVQETRNLIDSSLLHHLPDPEAQYEDQYCFVHPIFQEFLAARVISKCPGEELRYFATSASTHDSKMKLVLQFVAGFLRGERNHRINCLLQPLIRNNENRGPSLMLLMHCLFELHSEEWAKNLCHRLLQMEWIDLSSCGINDADCASLVYVLQHRQDTELNLENNKIGPIGCKRLAKLVESGSLGKLQLNNNRVSAEGVRHQLSEALKSRQCQLKYLNLSQNHLRDEGVRYLAHALDRESSTVEVLLVCYAGITKIGAKHLSIALKRGQCQLDRLSLDGNNIAFAGASELAKALEKYKLGQLELRNTGLPDMAKERLRDAVKKQGREKTNLIF